MLSCWYKRSELGIRTAIFFAAASLSGAFGGLLSVAISKMHSVGGLPNWSWIFILEGLGTVVAGILCLWLVQDFPDTARFLTDEQRAAIVHRLQEDGQFSAAGEGLRKQAIWEAISSPRTWLCMVFFCGSVMPLYAFSLFLPSIIKGLPVTCLKTVTLESDLVLELGYTSTKANLLTVPVYAFACIVTVMGGWIADRRQQRGYLHMYVRLRETERYLT
jgi:MFS family permease